MFLCESHGSAHAVEDLSGFFTGFVGSGLQNGIDLIGICHEFGAAGSHRGEVVPVGLGEAFFKISVAAAALFVVGDHSLVIFF